MSPCFLHVFLSYFFTARVWWRCEAIVRARLHINYFVYVPPVGQVLRIVRMVGHTTGAALVISAKRPETCDDTSGGPNTNPFTDVRHQDFSYLFGGHILAFHARRVIFGITPWALTCTRAEDSATGD